MPASADVRDTNTIAQKVGKGIQKGWMRPVLFSLRGSNRIHSSGESGGEQREEDEPEGVDTIYTRVRHEGGDRDQAEYKGRRTMGYIGGQ